MTDLTPFLWAVLASFCWGFAPIVEKFGLRGQADPSVGVFVRSLGVLAGALGFLFFTPRLGERLKAFSASNWTFLILGGLIASILGQLCFYKALKTGEVSRVTPIGASYPVLAFVLGVVLFQEAVTAPKIAGIVLVMAGVYLLR